MEELVRWVAENPTKCPAYNRSSQPHGKYVCTLGCGQRFTRRDSWKRHEELTYPQKVWFCDMGHFTSINGILKCTYCEAWEPDEDHVATMHPRQHDRGACHEKSFGWDVIFSRRERLSDHCKEIHTGFPCTEFVARNHASVNSNFPRQCVFCQQYQFTSWRDRIEHLAHYFETGTCANLSSPPGLPAQDEGQANEHRSNVSGDYFHHGGTSGNSSNRPSERNISEPGPSPGQGSSNSLEMDALSDIFAVMPSKLEETSNLLPQEPTYLPRRLKIHSQADDSCSDTAKDIKPPSRELKHSPKTSQKRKVFLVVPKQSEFGKSLGDMLFDARVQWSSKADEYFIPESALQEIITKERIHQEIHSQTPLDTLDDVRLKSHKIMLDTIFGNYRKVFAILVLIGKSDEILKFVSANIKDDQLPLADSKVQQLNSDGIHTAKSSAFDIMKAWSKRDVVGFYRDQWALTAPVFRFGKTIPHYEFDDQCRLPFILDPGFKSSQGGYGKVWKVKIHPAHLTFDTMQIKHELPCAIKQLRSNKQDDFEKEVSVLKSLSQYHHPHLVRLLATYRKDELYHLIFPCADGNLRTFWQHNPYPKHCNETAEWMLGECKALADALSFLHDSQTADSADDTSALSKERRYGRHGDIKPENILWFKNNPGDSSTDSLNDDMGKLVIADFGLSKIHHSVSRSAVDPRSIGGTLAYAPPELELGHTISRAYDIWSLGCVFLEFIMWYLVGSDYLGRFPKFRTRHDPGDEVMDSFFDIKTFNGSRRAALRTSVKVWIRVLRREPTCSPLMRDFLHLIERDMLAIDPKCRISADALQHLLEYMMEKSQLDIAFEIGRNINWTGYFGEVI
ncbi:kinase-like protein [Acephala macrosclerotiorum]|nr:kinase-like protein [Acephala macrosclerotiorum]